MKLGALYKSLHAALNKQTLTTCSWDQGRCTFLSPESVHAGDSRSYLLQKCYKIHGKSEGHGVGDLLDLSEEKWHLLHNTYHIKPILL